MKTIRQQIIEYLCIDRTAYNLSIMMNVSVADIKEHLKEINKNPKYKLEITPAECNKCGFVFVRKISKPGKCPKCKSTWISDPSFKIENQ